MGTTDATSDPRRGWYGFAGVIAFLAIAHILASPIGEPFKNNDETRQVMTGVFIRDVILDAPTVVQGPKQYALTYYGQYPALGLFVWPPFFHCVEGSAMVLFGTSYLTARLVVYAFALLAMFSTYRMVTRTHGSTFANVVVLYLGMSPLVFDYTGYVLLEVPTLAMLMTAIDYFERYLAGRRGRDAVLTGVFAALAALTRFDGVLFLIYVVIRLVSTRNVARLIDRPVLVGLALATVIALPYYVVTSQIYGAGLKQAAMSGTNEAATSFFDPRNLLIYPSFIPDQIHWGLAGLAIIGAVVALIDRDRRAAPALALFLATYFMFVPFAEPESRHAIYWIPSLAIFAVTALERIARMIGRWPAIILGLLVLAYTTHNAVVYSGWSFEGNATAAEYIVQHAKGDRPILIDGELNGGFIYYVRRNDPDRRFWIVRGDKLIYAVLSDPHGGYRELAHNEKEILDRLQQYDPEYIVLEQPLMLFDLPGPRHLREVVEKHPEEFELVETIPYRSDHHIFKKGRLDIYRKRTANPQRTSVVELPVLGLGTTIRVER